MNDKFDIYCAEKFALDENRFSRICAVDPVMRFLGRKNYVDDDGYLGVSLSQLQSLWVVKVFRQMGIETCPVAEKYKASTISRAMALLAAQDFLVEQRAVKPEYEFEEIEERQVPWWLSKFAYGYFAKSKKMLNDGLSPAGITICVDRESGLIWNERELIEAELPLMLME